MLIVLMRPNLVGVDGVFFRVSLEGLDERVQMIQYDTKAEVGRMFFRPEEKTSVAVRDFDAEKELLEDAIKKNQDISKLAPVHKSVKVERPDEEVRRFNYRPFYDLWLAQVAEEEERRNKREKG